MFGFFSKARTLVSAAEKGDATEVTTLLGSARFKPIDIIRAIHRSAQSNKEEALVLLIESTGGMLRKLSIETALAVSMLEDNVNIVSMLLANYDIEESINKLDLPGMRGGSLLFVATLFSRSRIVAALLDKGADPNSGEYSALSQAISLGNNGCADLLRKCAAHEGAVVLDATKLYKFI